MKKQFQPEYYQKQRQYWQNLKQTLFGNTLPKEKIWDDVSEIVHVLKLIAQNPTGNHVYTPEGGWVNLKSVRLTEAPGLLELGFSEKRLVKPSFLRFVSFEPTLEEYDHFRLVSADKGDYLISCPVSPINGLTLDRPRLHQELGDVGFTAFIEQLIEAENVSS